MNVQSADQSNLELIRTIADRLAHALGRDGPIDPHLPFVDMGADSLILAETIEDINRICGIALSVGELFEAVDTVTKLARHIQAHGDHAGLLGRPVDIGAALQVEPAASLFADRAAQAAHTSAVGSPPTDELHALITRQLALMERQLAMLGVPPPSTTIASAQAPAKSAPTRPVTREAAVRPQGDARERAANAAPDRFAAFGIDLGRDNRGDDQAKVRHVAELVEKADAMRPKSKSLTQRFRTNLADNRASAGFRPLLKELVYPVLSDRGTAARIEDIDGNAYIDFTMGFGVHLFGHSPPFVIDALRTQLEIGLPVGPQSPLAGRAAELICEFTGHDRLFFCNSGTEATMTAARLARAATGKDGIVIFRNSYHGTFDGFLARPSQQPGESKPASRGTPQSFVEDTIVLDYGDESALAFIAEHHERIGAVLVEPVQSRAPELQPGEFLHDLRALTADKDIALIFDEVITGFRCAAGGAQAHFGVKADLCTYGKVIGGGMPIGLVAGSAKFLDAADGGWWCYGDDSGPSAPTIFMAGTFSKHPLAMAACVAVLEHIGAQGQSMYDRLDELAGDLCQRLDATFEKHGVAIEMRRFASLFRFAAQGNLDLFYHHLLLNGIFVWEGRNCFLSTAHTAQDVDRLVEAIDAICGELAPLDLVPMRPGRALQPLSDAQRRFARLETSGEAGSTACNLCFGFVFDPSVDAGRLADRVRGGIAGLEMLHARIDAMAGRQQPGLIDSVAVGREAIDGAGDEERIEFWLAEEQARPIDVAAGPPIRARIARFSDGRTALSLCVHHLACDGWGLDRLLGRILGPGDIAAGIGIAHGDWLALERSYRHGDQFAADIDFWNTVVQAIAQARSERPARFGSGDLRIAGRPGARARATLEPDLVSRIARSAREAGATQFAWLLAAYRHSLASLFAPAIPTVGIPIANRPGGTKDLVANCVNLLPLPPLDTGQTGFGTSVSTCKRQMADLLKHGRYPYADICDLYGAIAGTANESPVEATFNLEPITGLPRFDGIEARLVMPTNAEIELDLMCNTFLLGGEMRIELDYNRDAFEEDRVHALLNLFRKIVEVNVEQAAA